MAALPAPRARAQDRLRPVAIGEAIEGAVREIRSFYVDEVAVRSVAEGGLSGLARSVPPAGRAAFDEARKALSRARTDAEAIAALVRAVAQVAGRAEVEPTHPSLTAVLRGMATSLDPRSDYLPPDAAGIAPPDPAVGGIGLELAILGGEAVVVRPLPGGPSEGRVSAGDVLLALDGRPVAGLGLTEVVGRMRGPLGTDLAVTLRRPGDAGSHTLRIRRAAVRQPDLRSALFGRIAYVRPEAFRTGSVAEFRAALAGARGRAGGTLDGLVLDLRENSGGLLEVAAAVAGGLLPAGATVATLAGRTAANNRVLRASGDLAPDLPAVVVVGDGTAAGAEIVVGALRDHRRAPLVGRPTFGDGTVSTVALLATGGVLRITTARVTLPSGQVFDGAGLAPDLVVEPPEGSVAARLRAMRARDFGARRTPEAASPWPELADAVGRLGTTVPVAPPAEPGRPETDPEVTRATALLATMRSPAGKR